MGGWAKRVFLFLFSGAKNFAGSEPRRTAGRANVRQRRINCGGCGDSLPTGRQAFPLKPLPASGGLFPRRSRRRC